MISDETKEDIKNFKAGTYLIGVIVFLVLLILKITGTSAVSSWSWWWVTSPLWFPPVTFLAIAGVFIVVAVILLLGVVTRDLLH
jgi:hypothetical protein